MPVMWLPFYDFGSPVGLNAKNTADEQLFVYLSSQLLPLFTGSAFKDPKNPAVRGAPRVAAPRADQGKWLDFLLTQLMAHGCPAPSPKVVPGPSDGPNGQIVRTMNRLVAKLNPSEYRNPTFQCSALPFQGSLLATDLPMHMSKIESARSIWSGHIAKSAGPRRELPFYDVSQKVWTQSANYVPSSNLPPSAPATMDELLVVTLLRLVFNFLPSLFPGAPFASPNSTLGLTTIPIFGVRVKELGWTVDDTHCVGPAGTSTDSPSLIRPLNYYAALANFSAFVKLSGGGQWVPPALAQAVTANVKNLWA